MIDLTYDSVFPYGVWDLEMSCELLRLRIEEYVQSHVSQALDRVLIKRSLIKDCDFSEDMALAWGDILKRRLNAVVVRSPRVQFREQVSEYIARVLANKTESQILGGVTMTGITDENPKRRLFDPNGDWRNYPRVKTVEIEKTMMIFINWEWHNVKDCPQEDKEGGGILKFTKSDLSTGIGDFLVDGFVNSDQKFDIAFGGHQFGKYTGCWVSALPGRNIPFYEITYTSKEVQ